MFGRCGAAPSWGGLSSSAQAFGRTSCDIEREARAEILLNFDPQLSNTDLGRLAPEGVLLIMLLKTEHVLKDVMSCREVLSRLCATAVG